MGACRLYSSESVAMGVAFVVVASVALASTTTNTYTMHTGPVGGNPCAARGCTPGASGERSPLVPPASRRGPFLSMCHSRLPPVGGLTALTLLLVCLLVLCWLGFRVCCWLLPELSGPSHSPPGRRPLSAPRRAATRLVRGLVVLFG